MRRHHALADGRAVATPILRLAQRGFVGWGCLARGAFPCGDALCQTARLWEGPSHAALVKPDVYWSLTSSLDGNHMIRSPMRDQHRAF